MPIVANFRGRERFKTLRGGLVTLASLIVLFAFSWTLVTRWLDHQEPVITTYTRNWIASAESSQIDLRQNRMKFVFRILDTTLTSPRGVKFDPRAGRLVAKSIDLDIGAKFARIQRFLKLDVCDFGFMDDF